MSQTTKRSALPEDNEEQKKRNTIEATDGEKEIILRNLARYPMLSSIVLQNSLLYRVAFDQYKGKIPSERFGEGR